LKKGLHVKSRKRIFLLSVGLIFFATSCSGMFRAVAMIGRGAMGASWRTFAKRGLASRGEILREMLESKTSLPATALRLYLKEKDHSFAVLEICNSMNEIDFALDERPFVPDAIATAILMNDMSMLEAWVKRYHGYVNIRSAFGMPAIMLATLLNNKKAIDMLFTYGANPSEPDLYGNSPNRMELIKLLGLPKKDEE
jgi:hypothetical protein